MIMDDIHNQPEENILVADDLKELKDHGDFEYPVGIYENNLKNMYMEMVRWHWHDEVEFVFVNDGGGEFNISEDTCSFIHTFNSFFNCFL